MLGTPPRAGPGSVALRSHSGTCGPEGPGRAETEPGPAPAHADPHTTVNTAQNVLGARASEAETPATGLHAAEAGQGQTDPMTAHG